MNKIQETAFEVRVGKKLSCMTPAEKLEWYDGKVVKADNYNSTKTTEKVALLSIARWFKTYNFDVKPKLLITTENSVAETVARLFAMVFPGEDRVVR